jgi:hypothetical protein
MSPRKETRQALSYLRRKYAVSERDLISLAKKLEQSEEPEEDWEQITRKFLINRKIRLQHRQNTHR